MYQQQQPQQNQPQQQSSASYSYGGHQAPSYSYYGGGDGAAPTGQGVGGGGTGGSSLLRRRNVEHQPAAPPAPSSYGAGTPRSSSTVVKKLDFMFPKVDDEYTVRTERGGAASILAYGLMFLLAVAEIVAWSRENASTSEHISVDTSLGKKMKVNLNITFPALACEDLHVDVMDVAGDSHLNVEESMKKRRMDLRGRYIGAAEEAAANIHQQKQAQRDKLLTEGLPDDYCGPCYGAHEKDDDCCNTCDELLAAYSKKRWSSNLVLLTAEQCVREGRDQLEPKKMSKGEGCELSGVMTLNRVAGNFHVAMGEGVERDGKHIHSFLPDDTPNFNASHIINHLSFGAPESEAMVEIEDGTGTSLKGVKKIVGREHGTTGLFQYFIKIVPTTYVGKGTKGEKTETNRYFYTERFRPLMSEYLDDDAIEDADDDSSRKTAKVQAGHGGSHSHHGHHDVRNSVLPGVFFIYEIYPFAVEISQVGVPWTHLLIRLMATVGGVLTIIRWLDSLLFERSPSSSRRR